MGIISFDGVHDTVIVKNGLRLEWLTLICKALLYLKTSFIKYP